MKQYNVHVVFDQPVLGTGNADPMIHERFIASKAPDAPSLKEEVAALGADAVEERGTTIFPKTKDGNPFLWDYQVKGYLKDACGFMAQATGSRSAAIPTYRSKIDGTVFVSPRNIRLNMPEGEVMRIMQRPLRAQTMQGPRVALEGQLSYRSWESNGQKRSAVEVVVRTIDTIGPAPSVSAADYQQGQQIPLAAAPPQVPAIEVMDEDIPF